MEKGIRNADAVACKLRPASIQAINDKLEVAREQRQKREDMVKKQKIEAIVTKCQRARGRICSSNKGEENYESDTEDETDLDQAGNGKTSLQL